MPELSFLTLLKITGISVLLPVTRSRDERSENSFRLEAQVFFVPPSNIGFFILFRVCGKVLFLAKNLSVLSLYVRTWLDQKFAGKHVTFVLLPPFFSTGKRTLIPINYDTICCLSGGTGSIGYFADDGKAKKQKT